MSREYRDALILEQKGLRQAARRRRLGPGRVSGRAWYRGVNTANPKRIGNLSGEAYISSSRMAAAGYGKHVMKLRSRGRYFDHNKRGALRGLPRKLRGLVANTRDPNQVGALYNTNHKLRRALVKRGYAGVQWRHGGASVRYAFDSERTLSRTR